MTMTSTSNDGRSRWRCWWGSSSPSPSPPTLLQLPLFFQLISGYGPLVAVVATLPFIIALIVTGPIVGVLLGRVGPRPLITIGVLAVGLGNILLAARRSRPARRYLFFILPLAFIGAGFVIATTVRTAIIFASVPRGLPATAAALNEASVAMGTRAGLVVGTLTIATLAVSNLTAAMAGQPPATIDAAVAVLRELLVAIGSPGYGALVEGVAQPERVEFGLAYTDAVRSFLGITGVVTFIAAAVTWFLVGRRDPLTSVWEHRDERTKPRPDGRERSGRPVRGRRTSSGPGAGPHSARPPRPSQGRATPRPLSHRGRRTASTHHRSCRSPRSRPAGLDRCPGRSTRCRGLARGRGSPEGSGRPWPSARLGRVDQQVPAPAEPVDDPVEVALRLAVALVVGEAGPAAVVVAGERQSVEADGAP